MSLRAIPGSIRRARDEPAETLLKTRDAVVSEDKGDLKRKLESVDLATSSEIRVYPEDADDEEGSNDSSSEDDADEEEALIRELMRIKQERADEELKQQAREAAKEAARQESHAVSSNPLYSSSLRRRWDDDTVFHAQATANVGPKKFVNDVVRSEFHQKFLAKYIQ